LLCKEKEYLSIDAEEILLQNLESSLLVTKFHTHMGDKIQNSIFLGLIMLLIG